MVQELYNKSEGWLERSQPIAYLEAEVGANVVSGYAADGTHLCNVGYRPYEEEFSEQHYLFLC